MATYLTHLECSSCAKQHSPHQLINLCDCGMPLLARYDLPAIRTALKREDLSGRGQSMWRYRELLPAPESAIVTLGEGFTPLIPARRLGEELGLSKLWIKEESANPTGSFKARGMAAAVTMARLLGARKLAVPSAGNAAGALAAYAARAGMEANIFMPRDVPPANRQECELVGARVNLIDGLITDCGRLVAERKIAEGWFDVSTLKEPYRIEGKKTLGLELAEQLGWSLPDVIVYPTGGGTGLIGMWKAFDEMEQLGWIGPKRPRMVTVQAEGCAPIVKAFQENRPRADAWSSAFTQAAGLRVPKAIGDFIMLDILRRSQGTAVAVSDAEMLADVHQTGEKEGLLMAPEGAATVSALRKLRDARFVQASDEVVLFNTATGLKYLHLFP
jgi:threonine synthase